MIIVKENNFFFSKNKLKVNTFNINEKILQFFFHLCL